MSEMIERAARAAYECWIEPVRDLEPAWDALPESHKQRMYDSQRKAIEAFREVSAEMKTAGMGATGGHGYDGLCPSCAEDVFHAMIDAALSEDKT